MGDIFMDYRPWEVDPVLSEQLHGSDFDLKRKFILSESYRRSLTDLTAYEKWDRLTKSKAIHTLKEIIDGNGKIIKLIDGVDGESGMVSKYFPLIRPGANDLYISGTLSIHEAFTGFVLIDPLIDESILKGETPLFGRTLGYQELSIPSIVGETGKIITIVYLEKISPHVDISNWLWLENSGDPGISKTNQFKSILWKLFSKLNDYYRRFSFTHYDLHMGNVMINPQDNDIKIIDFESTYFVLSPELSAKAHIPSKSYGTQNGSTRHYDRPNWIHDIFMLLSSIYQGLKTIIKWDRYRASINIAYQKINESFLNDKKEMCKRYGVVFRRWQDYITFFPRSDDVTFWKSYGEDNDESYRQFLIEPYMSLKNINQYYADVQKMNKELVTAMVEIDGLIPDISNIDAIKYNAGNILGVVSELIYILRSTVSHEYEEEELDEWFDTLDLLNPSGEANFDSTFSSSEYFDMYLNSIKRILNSNS